MQHIFDSSNEKLTIRNMRAAMALNILCKYGLNPGLIIQALWNISDLASTWKFANISYLIEIILPAWNVRGLAHPCPRL